MRAIPPNDLWQHLCQDGIHDDGNDDVSFEPYPIARAGEWFFSSVGLSRSAQAALTVVAGVAGLLTGLSGLAALFSFASAPSSASAYSAATSLLVGGGGFAMGAAAFYALAESEGYADIEACRPEVKVAAAVSIIAGLLVAAAVVVVGLVFVISGLILRAIARD